MNWPLSVFGKKSCPSQGTSANVDRQASKKTGTKIARRLTSVARSISIAVAKSFEAPLESAVETERKRLRERTPCCFTFNRYIASVGTSVRDRMYDAIMANTTASASGTNR